MAVRLKLRKYSEGVFSLESFGHVDRHGFCLSLSGLLPEEVDADQFSIDAILAANSDPTFGFYDLEVHRHNWITWATFYGRFFVAVGAIRNSGAEWIREINPSSDT